MSRQRHWIRPSPSLTICFFFFSISDPEIGAGKRKWTSSPLHFSRITWNHAGAWNVKLGNEGEGGGGGKRGRYWGLWRIEILPSSTGIPTPFMDVETECISCGKSTPRLRRSKQTQDNTTNNFPYQFCLICWNRSAGKRRKVSCVVLPNWIEVITHRLKLPKWSYEIWFSRLIRRFLLLLIPLFNFFSSSIPFNKVDLRLLLLLLLLLLLFLLLLLLLNEINWTFIEIPAANTCSISLFLIFENKTRNVGRIVPVESVWAADAIRRRHRMAILSSRFSLVFFCCWNFNGGRQTETKTGRRSTSKNKFETERSSWIGIIEISAQFQRQEAAETTPPSSHAGIITASSSSVAIFPIF